MGLNAATFLHDVKGIVTGNGFLKTISDVSMNDLTEADGDKLDNGSTPPLAALESNGLGVAVASSTTFAGCLNFTLPRDYDQSNDYLKIRILCGIIGGTDSGDTMDCTAYVKRANTALGSDLDPDVSGAMGATVATVDWVELDLSGNSLQGGDVVHVTLSTSAHTNDAVHIYALEVEYKSCFVYFSKDSDR